MYKLCRAALMFSMLEFAYALAGVMVCGWPWSMFAFAGAMGIRTLRKGRSLWAHGTSRWASADDLRGVSGDSGLILGRLGTTELPSLRKAIWALFDRKLGAKEACDRFLSAGWLRRRRPIVRLSKAVHSAIFAPTGVGKGVSIAVPFLLTCPDSCVVVDFKGELAKLTSKHRRKAFGHRIVLLDPFKAFTQRPDSFNALQFINPDSPTALDECRDLAEALVIRTGQEKEPHWADSAEVWIAAMIAAVVQYAHAENRSLQRVREMLTSQENIEAAIKVMCESDVWDGMLARLGHQLTHFKEKELSSVLTTTNRFLRFLDTLAIAESTKSSSFYPSSLLKGKTTVFLILLSLASIKATGDVGSLDSMEFSPTRSPLALQGAINPEHARACSGLLRLWVGSMLRACVRGGLQEKHKVHFVLDEAASLGHMEALDDAVDKYRGYGVRLQFYYQSLGQLKKCWPEGQDQTLLANTSQIYFGINDVATAEAVSARLGEETIIVDSGGRSNGTSSQTSRGAQSSSGRSSNANNNWQQISHKLLKADQVMALHEREAITFTPGCPPIWTFLLRYYEEKGLGRPRRFVTALKTLAGSLLAVLYGAAIVALVSLVIERMSNVKSDAGFLRGPQGHGERRAEQFSTRR